MPQHKNSIFVLILLGSLLLSGCVPAPEAQQAPVITSLQEVPSVRLNFRYEADVPPPVENKAAPNEEKNVAVQADFDRSRPHEQLDRTVASPDGKRVLAIYHQMGDLQSQYRLDMYSPDGILQRKITADSMAVHFPDTILWSPDSSTIAFVATTRGVSPIEQPTPPSGADPEQVLSPSGDVNADTTVPSTPEGESTPDLEPEPTPVAPSNVLTFRTEQIYICNSDGDQLKPLTQNEGLIYFYFVWSGDSSMLAALAATSREWQFLEYKATENNEQFVPIGRPRVIERSGRERRLDDGLTAVQPIWSPDSAKVACAFDKQVRIYDAAGDAPTQAAIPLRNYLLLSSQAYDRDQQSRLEGANVSSESVGESNSTNVNGSPVTTLPDERTLVSFNPIVALSWPSEDLLYFQTAFLRRMKNDAESVMSFPRWHRLVLTPQPAILQR